MKKILLGVTSGIACYKALDLTSQLTKNSKVANVQKYVHWHFY